MKPTGPRTPPRVAATMSDWMVSEPAWMTGPGGLSGSVRPPTSCAPSCSDALVQMRTAAQLPWHVVAAPNEASRWSGGFRTDCTGCLKHAHTLLARFATHQAKLDRYSALIAEGKKPMGRPPVPMQDSTASGAQCRGRRTSRYCGREPVGNPSKTAAESGGKYHRSAITDHADPQGIPVGLQRGDRRDWRSAHRRGPGGRVHQRSSVLSSDDAVQNVAALYAATRSSDHVIGTVQV
jgi:hypothetical protein